MTTPEPDSLVERSRRVLSRTFLFAATGLLAGGLVMSPMVDRAVWVVILRTACAMLLAIQVFSVVAVLLEEFDRRDWPFVGAAAMVIALVCYSVIDKLG